MFTIEDLIEKIYEPKTKELFKDVYTSYTQGQYRATVVMLWTVVVCDLIYKLQYLKDIYNDSVAIDILNKIADKQKKNPKNPEWENYLLQEVNLRTQLVTDIEKENLEYLQKQRNLSAHPIITNENILFKPTKELTRSLMRTALDSILLKTPLLAKEYVDIILEDFEKKKEEFIPWDDNFDKYFQNRYINHLNNNQILNLYKLIWRMVFLPHDDRELKNITINIQLLDYIFIKFKTECINYMNKSIDYYTYDNSIEVAKFNFNSFLFRHKELYQILSESTKALLEAETRIFPDDIPFIFIKEKNFNECIKQISLEFNNRPNCITNNNLISHAIAFKNVASEHNELNTYYNICIDWYANSYSFDEANLFFTALIRLNYKNFNKEQILKFIESSSKNSQTYYRKKANDDHRLIMKRFIELDGLYDDIRNTPFEDLYIELGGVPF